MKSFFFLTIISVNTYMFIFEQKNHLILSHLFKQKK